MDIDLIQNYFAKNMGVDIVLSNFDSSTLPNFLRRQFYLYQSDIFDKSVCFLISKNNIQSLSNLKIEELLSAYETIKKQNYQPIFVFAKMSKRERQMLVLRKLSFLVPNTQMFLPFVGVDFADNIAVDHISNKTFLRPAAQAILIEQLLNNSLQGLSVNKVAQVMNYTAMGALRGVNQLNDLGLCEIINTNISKTLNFSLESQTLWREAKKVLRSPIKRTIAIQDNNYLKGYPFAGEFALANHSDLALERKCYAMTIKEFNKLKENNLITIIHSPEIGNADIQIWSYTLPSWNIEVDLYSLWLSFQDSTDPRIKIALLNIEEKEQW